MAILRHLRDSLTVRGPDNFLFADKSEVILPLRTEGVVIHALADYRPLIRSTRCG
jgi:hypothetical protein